MEVLPAHLRRDFQAMIDRDGDGAEVSATSLAVEQAVRVLAQGPRRHHPTIDVSPGRGVVAADGPVEPGAAGRIAPAETAATCGESLRLGDCLWTFSRVSGVEPTNNAAGTRCGTP